MALRLVAEAQPMLSGQQAGGDERAFLQLLAAHHLAPGAGVDGGLLGGLLRRPNLLRLVSTSAGVTSVAYSPDGRYVVSGSDGTLVRRNADSLLASGVPLAKHDPTAGR